MPTPKAIHICNSHKTTLQLKIVKEYDFTKADGLKNKKYDHTTLCISNSGFSVDLKHKNINQRSVLSGSLVA